MIDVAEREKTESLTIGDAVKLTGLSADTLRYYEKSEVIGPIDREESGRRRYSRKDMEWLDFVNCLKSTGMPLDTIREYRRLMMLGNETAAQRKELMVLHKEYLEHQMTELQAAMNHINWKIEFYDDILNSSSHSF
ncbi:MerR family transcriptional regulator [Spirochaeta isovalerica]|uniref:DNA-binding transcriptional MerR regulator n=1 Tax=Spirochaeta isovalerica TaxID=150 RepID=A0A841RGG9_9SPIO|nr:MerR family transcriptional regulator [Spirochaeta isovalerica]MBB6482110.1 DNA-binding transcriptional MerR regulator [Spirochaeta isovalerica]